MHGERVKFYPLAWSEDKFFFFSVLRCFTARAFKSPKNCHYLPSFSISLFFVRSLLLYIILLCSFWSSICWSCRSPLECLSYQAPSSTCCELQQTRWHYSGVIPSLMRPDCQLRAFNAELTASPIIAPPPYPHSCPPVLVLLFGTTERAALEGVLFFPSMTPVRRGRDGPQRCLPAALGLPYLSSDVFPSSAWALSLTLNRPKSPNPLAPQTIISKI